MKMTKDMYMLIGVGAVIVAVAGGLGWRYVTAMGECDEAKSSLESDMSSLRNYYSAPVFPSRASIEAVKSNKMDVVSWYDAAMAAASLHDEKDQTGTGAAFKQELQNEVRELSNLKGGVAGKIAAQGFWFGFDEFLGENGTLPANDQVPMLKRQLEFVSHIVNIVSDVGGNSVTKIVRVAKPVEDPAKPKPGQRKVKKQNQDESKQLKLDFVLGFTARPAALVRILNEISKDDYFVVASNLSILTADDGIAAKLGTKKEEGEKGGNRRNRRRAQVVEEENAEETAKKERLVSDPESMAPLTVELELSLYDFGGNRDGK